MTTLTDVAARMRYPDLCRRLLTAYQWDSAGEDPTAHGDPRCEDKLGAKLASYDDAAFVHLMYNIAQDTPLHPTAQRELGEYAIRLRTAALNPVTL